MIGALLGAVLGAGALLGYTGLRPGPPRARRRPDIRAARGAVVGLVVYLATGWPVAAAAGAAAAWAWQGRRERFHPVERLEAIAAWVEMLRDTMAAAAGVEGAIRASAAVAPTAVAAEVQALAGSAERGQLEEGLVRFADSLADPTADLVVVALRTAARGQARDVRDLLSALATMARDEVAMRGRIEAARARTRTSVRIIVGTTLVFAAVLVVFNRGYFAPYSPAAGQGVLAGVLATWALGLAWLRAMANMETVERFLGRP